MRISFRTADTCKQRVQHHEVVDDERDRTSRNAAPLRPGCNTSKRQRSGAGGGHQTILGTDYETSSVFVLFRLER